MEQLEARLWIEIIAVATIPLTVLLIMIHRIVRDRSPGVRSIQFLAMGTIPALVLILGLEGLLESSAIGALLGALVGYVFSNIGKYDERKAGNKDA